MEVDMDLGNKKAYNIDFNRAVRVLITGAGSYIGQSFEKYALEHYSRFFKIDTLDMKRDEWKEFDFSSYDSVFHVAGIAHADVAKVDEDTKKLYYSVNTDLTIDTANKAKASGVKQFVFMSSMIIYGGAECVNENTSPQPASFYGDSKWQADIGVRKLSTADFAVAVLRPPMIYGRGSKGNYPVLAKIAKKTPVFPAYPNKRSMLYIENLCEFLCRLILSGKEGVFFPQNAEYSNTSEIVVEIGRIHGRSIRLMGILTPVVRLCMLFPGKIGNLATKAFGSSYYDQNLSKYEGLEYQLVGLKESIERTESVL